MGSSSDSGCTDLPRVGMDPQEVQGVQGYGRNRCELHKCAVRNVDVYVATTMVSKHVPSQQCHGSRYAEGTTEKITHSNSQYPHERWRDSDAVGPEWGQRTDG
jgi:hypothetical protein